MKFLLTVVFIGIIGLILSWITQLWWTPVLPALAVPFVFHNTPGRAFLAGFSGGAFLWLNIAVIVDNRNAHILSARMAKLFSLPHYFLFIVVSMIVIGLVCGFGSATGSILRNALRRK